MPMPQEADAVDFFTPHFTMRAPVLLSLIERCAIADDVISFTPLLRLSRSPIFRKVAISAMLVSMGAAFARFDGDG